MSERNLLGYYLMKQSLIKMADLITQWSTLEQSWSVRYWSRVESQLEILLNFTEKLQTPHWYRWIRLYIKKKSWLDIQTML